VGVTIQASAEQGQQLAQSTPTGMGFLEHVVPQSFFEAASKNEVLQIVFFSILFAVALSQVRGRPKEIVLAGCEGLAEVMFKFTAIVMRYAPIGIGAAIAVTVGHSGLGVLLNLGKLILTLYGALIVLIVVVFVPVAIMFRVPIRRFLVAVREPALIAFSTTSSEAALPRAMQAMEAIGVPRRIVAFVMPTGYSFNLDGSTLYLAVASMFVAQAAGVNLTFGQQLVMMLTLMITSKGVAAVPRASLVILAGTLHTFGLPLEGIAIILGVDELMDMARTSVNLVGNCLATVVMAKWEGEYVVPQPEARLAQEGLLPIESVPPAPRTSGAAPAAS
jgi:proton glutamate symport protein